ncbi:MAG: sugar phosphate isomerase/epimerase [Acidobacteriaceae bacterium]|nr:sugar phosphate isomerase/epimerase [Acidobacteriaceae bacterium]
MMFWGDTEPLKMIRAVKSLGIRCGHLGFTGAVPLAGLGAVYKQAFAEEGFSVTAVFAAYDGESYADAPTVEKTVGFIPAATRAEREARTYEVIDQTAAMGVPIFACHVGFVPEDHAHPNYAPVRDLVRRICDYAAKHGITFALETGQEPAASLLHFLEDVDRPNLKLNFDPANLILYGTSEPIAALELVGKHVVSVHAKDGNWPDPAKPGTLGTEMPLGQGSVGMANFVNTLKKVGYTGPLTIEREVSLDQDMDDRHQAKLAHVDDIKAAIELLRSLR